MADQRAARYGMHPNSEMNAIGWAIFTVMAILLVPLLPFFLLYVLIDALGADAGDDVRTEPSD